MKSPKVGEKLKREFIFLFLIQQFHHGNKQGFWICKDVLTQAALYFYAHDIVFVFDSF